MTQQLVLDPDALRRLRLERGLSQRELAAAAGMPQCTVTRAEAGRMSRPSTIRRFAEVLEVEPTRIAKIARIV